MHYTKLHLPVSLTNSIVKETVYGCVDIQWYSDKSAALKVIAQVRRISKGIFCGMIAAPTDIVYIPIAFVLRKLWNGTVDRLEADHQFTIEVVGRRFGFNKRKEIPVERSKEMMENPTLYVPKTIHLPIAECSDLTLTENNLGKICKRINAYTLNIPYSWFHIASRHYGSLISPLYVHRPNHNGTHAARQTRYFQSLIDLISKEGSDAAKQTVASITPEEMLHLQLAQYLYRAGRVDESSGPFKISDIVHKIRSAAIYKAYAKQLCAAQLNSSSDHQEKGRVEKLIDWTADIILNSCTYLENNRTVTSDKDIMCCKLFNICHNMDLYRCNGKSRLDKYLGVTTFTPLSSVLGCNQNIVKEQYWPKLEKLVVDVLKATGTGNRYHKIWGDDMLFGECSLDGELCWEKVFEIPLPSWK